MDILFTTTAKIRATLGCDELDLPDEVIDNRSLDLLMEERLSIVYAGYDGAIDDATERRLTLWCQYFGALTLIEDASLALAQTIQSNTDKLSRFAIDFAALKADLAKKVNKLEGDLNPTLYATAFSPMGLATPGYNVITGI